MGKAGAQNRRKSAKASKNRALNAFDTAVDDEYYVKGLRQQQDIDLEHIADDRIRELMSGQVNSEDDEDIDSDDAMGSASDISLGEPDSDDEDKWGDSVDEDELLPLSEVWDLNNSDTDAEKDASSTEPRESAASSKARKGSTEPVQKDDSPDSRSDESDSSQSDDEESESDEDEEDEEDELSLDQSEGESSGSEDVEEDNRLLREAIKKIGGHGEAGPSKNNKLIQAEEENPFALPQTSESTLTLQDLAPGVKSAKTLSIPAPQRVQDRADRSAAFDLAKDEVDKWAEVVSANRRAEHLQFPINPPPEFQSASPLTPAEAKDRNSLENSVAKILNESQLADEQAISTFEEMAPSKLSLEELRERRNKLRYMRDLMLREEQRAKRIKKIKSKKYRKIHKKERERMAELEQDEEENEHAAVEKAERDRALERATLRHKNNSKWAQQVLAHGLTRDSNTRADVEEMLRQSDALRQKIRGNEEEGEDDERSLGDLENAYLQAGQESDDGDSGNGKGVLGMKFMRDAAKREQEQNRKMLRDDYASDDEDRNIGRKSYNPAGQQLKRDMEAMKEAEERDDRRDTSEKKAGSKRKHSDRPERGDEVVSLVPQDRDNSGDIGNARKHQASTNTPQQTAPQTLSENPWLAASAKTSVPGTVKLAAPAPRNSSSGSGTAPAKRSRNAQIVVENTFGDSLMREKDISLEQQALVRQAFAGDDVLAEFEAEKKADVDETGDKEIDETLPGWGSWSNEAPRVKKVRKIVGVNERQRQDYKKQNVIINEKINKKAAKYNASAVPFPFENRQQYERSLRMPIGQEWVSKDTFQRQTKPRVLVKRGSVIDPIKKPHSN